MQKIFNGIVTLHNILKDFKCENMFLVVDSSYPFLSIKNTIENLPIRRKIVFSDFTPNPVYEEVCKGVELFKVSECDSILAVGGGSAIDVAKCIKLGVKAKEGTLALIPPLVSQQLMIDETNIPFIAIPTTAGTGSESTHNAVMYYEGNKQTITNDAILPDFAVLESSVLKTLPLYQKKCTMMDALCQGIESWWSVNSTSESKIYSQKAIELIMSNWRRYIFNNDFEAADKIMLAANYSGRAINITQTTAPHAFSYKITSLYKLPHGHAVAICLPQIWKYMISNYNRCIDSRGFAYLENIFNDISHSMDCDSPIDAIRLFEKMLCEMNLVNPIAMRREEELSVLSSSVNPVRLKNNPIEIRESEAYRLYNSIIY